MAFEGLGSGPFSRGFSRTTSALAAQRNSRTAAAALTDKQQAARTDRFMKRFDESQQLAETTAQQFNDVAVQMIEAGQDATPEFQQVLEGQGER